MRGEMLPGTVEIRLDDRRQAPAAARGGDAQAALVDDVIAVGDVDTDPIAEADIRRLVRRNPTRLDREIA
jgi:hypothetical protein